MLSTTHGAGHGGRLVSGAAHYLHVLRSGTLLIGYVRDIRSARPVEPAVPAGVMTVVVTCAAESPWPLSREDHARFASGATAIGLVAPHRQLLAIGWILVGAQHPRALDAAVSLRPHVAYLTGFHTHPSHRRVGLGRYLIALHEEHARVEGATGCFAWIERRNTASRRLFGSMGWRPAVCTVRWALKPGFAFTPTLPLGAWRILRQTST